MADESLHVPLDQNIDYHIVTLFQRLEAMRKDSNPNGHFSIGARLSSTIQPKRNMHAEFKSLEFWGSFICEFLASFLYIFIVCGSAAGAGVGASVSSVLLVTALASGLTMATLTQIFMQISGAHINPAVTVANCVIRAISPLRAFWYITAQCGGGIAGAALLYGVTVTGYDGNLKAANSHTSALPAWERFSVEFILTFVVVLAYFVSMDSQRRYLGNASLAIGAAYSACTFVSMPYLNPARSLGLSVVLTKWDNHWVYWMGPLVGGAVSGIVYKYIFNSRKSTKKSMDSDSSSIHSEDDLNYDIEIERPKQQTTKFQGSTYNAANGQVTNQGAYCQNLYSTPPLTKSDQPEPLYGGTRSMYCRSPPLTRANLNRSQSVYAKSNTAINRDIVPRAGPLVPAQSLYPMRTAQNSHLQNQNVQNQLQQRSESIYGIRGSTRQQTTNQQQQQSHQHQIQNQQQMNQQQQQQGERPQQDNQGFQPVYGSRHNPAPTDNAKFESRTLDSRERSNRPESVYGLTAPRGRGQSAQSDDSSYGSYHGSAITPPARNPNGEVLMYAPPPGPGPQGGQMRAQTDRKLSSGGPPNGGPCDRQQAVSFTSGNQAAMVSQHYGMLPMRPN